MAATAGGGRLSHLTLDQTPPINVCTPFVTALTPRLPSATSTIMVRSYGMEEPLFVILVTFLVLAWVSCLLRAWVKVLLIKKVGADDYLMLCGIVGGVLAAQLSLVCCSVFGVAGSH